MSTRIPLRMLAVASAIAMTCTACANTAGSSGDTGGAPAADAPLVIATDLPLQGTGASQNQSSNQLTQVYLDSIGGKVGQHPITLKFYDNSTAAKGAWDEAACSKNAIDHVNAADEVAVIGTQNSGCTKIELPTLNQDPNGPMLMISPSNTNPGLTKAWETGEPDKYYPTGNRNFARVTTTDDYQGGAGAAFAATDLKAKKCFVLNDNQTYGQGVAKSFIAAAPNVGIEVVGDQVWDPKQPNYGALFQSVKASGADCVYLGGIYDNNGGQLVKDKVAVLGPNDGAVKLLAPDGFTGYPDLLQIPQSEGMYLSFAGLAASQFESAGGATKKLLDAYKAKHGEPPVGNYPLYGVAALQVILAAIERSDGTRKGVNAAVFSGEGITIPADQSVTGKEIEIDPASGDTTSRDTTIEIVKDGKETFFKSQSLE